MGRLVLAPEASSLTLDSFYRVAKEQEEIPSSTLVLALPCWFYFLTTTNTVKFNLYPLVLS